MALPPLEDGAVKTMVAAPPLTEMEVMVGAPGVVNGVAETADEVADPSPFVAVTVQEAGVPLMRLVTIRGETPGLLVWLAQVAE